MSNKQVILGGYPNSTFINETGIRQTILSSVLVDETGGALAFYVDVAETLTAATAQTVTIRAVPNVIEAMTATATQRIDNLPTRFVAETLSVTDHPGIAFFTITENTMHAVDHINRTILSLATVTDTLNIIDHPTAGIRRSVVEALNIAEVITEGTDSVFRRSINEILDVVDHIHVSFRLRVDEFLNPVTLHSAGLNHIYNLSIQERFGGSITTQTLWLKAIGIVREVLSAADHASAQIGVPGIWDLTVEEILHVRDIAIDPETFVNPGLYFWGYHWAYGKYPLLTVYCAGLDCGDHPVRPDGSVFVPWGSDPDNLFYPSWLFQTALDSAPPIPIPDPFRREYGATACNVDITANDGKLLRITIPLAIGLPYHSRVQTLRPNTPELSHSPYGPSLAETRRLHQFGIHLSTAQGVSVGTNVNNLRRIDFRDPRGNKYPKARFFTGIHHDLIDDDYSFDGMLMAEIFRPYPTTISAIIGFSKTFDRGE